MGYNGSIMSGLSISIQGEAGSFHHLATQHLFGDDAVLLCRDNFAEVFADVGSKKALHGIVAIENSLAGSLNEVYDLLRANSLQITGEIYMRISLNLVGLDGAKLAGITGVHSHPVALLECDQYLGQMGDSIDIHERHDTAGSAAYVAKLADPTQVAIASSQAARLHNLKILASDIETDKQNHTRFVVLSHKSSVSEDRANKTSIVITANHTPGALYNVLGAFAKRDINLSKLESRPIIGRSWHYHFYLDFEAGLHEDRTQQALDELKEYTGELTVLGSYPKGEVIE